MRYDGEQGAQIRVTRSIQDSYQNVKVADRPAIGVIKSSGTMVPHCYGGIVQSNSIPKRTTEPNG